MNPLDMFYSWQSLVMATVVAGATQAFKTVLNGTLAPATARHPLVKAVVLPAFPLVLGAVLSLLVPIHPEALDAFVRSQGGATGVYALWGAALGTFSDYLYQRAKTMAATASPSPTATAVPPAVTAAVAEVAAVVHAIEAAQPTPAVTPVAEPVAEPAAEPAAAEPAATTPADPAEVVLPASAEAPEPIAPTTPADK